MAVTKPMDQIKWQELEVGNVIPEPGNAREYLTGDWKSERPVVNKEDCIKCGMCWMFCPDAAINEDEEGYFEADYSYCKGCGICAEECPKSCITMIEEEK
jgi:pyruvate ferredoxin oxidoreductase delta subunit